jgi:hypothetical protein
VLALPATCCTAASFCSALFNSAISCQHYSAWAMAWPSTHLTLALNGPPTLLWKEHLVPLRNGFGWVPQCLYASEKWRRVLLFVGIEPLLLGHAACSLVTTGTKFSESSYLFHMKSNVEPTFSGEQVYSLWRFTWQTLFSRYRTYLCICTEFPKLNKYFHMIMSSSVALF